MKRGWLCLALSSVLLACEHSRPVGEVHSEARPQLAAMLETHCTACHEIGEAARRPARAMEAALMVSAGRMPEAPETMTAEDRRALVAELCELGAANPEVCRSALEGQWQTDYVRDPAEFLRAVNKIVPTDKATAEQSVATGLLLIHTVRSDRVVQEDPTLVILTALLAAERCPVADETNRCVRALLDPLLIKVPKR